MCAASGRSASSLRRLFVRRLAVNAADGLRPLALLADLLIELQEQLALAPRVLAPPGLGVSAGQRETHLRAVRRLLDAGLQLFDGFLNLADFEQHAAQGVV